MPSHRFKNASVGRPARNPSHNFLSTFSAGPSYPYGNVYSSADMAYVEESVNDLAHIDKRSAHNALERQRRENLNSKFQQLAHALPSLQTVRRPSKTVIVAKSLEFVSSSVTRETKFQSQIEHLRRENERLRDQAVRTKRTPTKQVAPSTASSSSSASSIMERPMYLSPDQLLLSNAHPTEPPAQGTAQISPPPSPQPNTSPKSERKLRQDSTSSLNASFTMMITSDAAPPPDQSAIAALAERRSVQRGLERSDMMPFVDQQDYFGRVSQQQQQPLMMNMAAAPPFIDPVHGSAMMNGNYPMIGYSQPATTGYPPDGAAITHYPLMDMSSVFPPPYFQHDPNHGNYPMHWVSRPDSKRAV